MRVALWWFTGYDLAGSFWCGCESDLTYGWICKGTDVTLLIELAFKMT